MTVKLKVCLHILTYCPKFGEYYNTQCININNPDPESVKRFFFDSKINEFFDHFLQDITEIVNSKMDLIVCRFRGNGFDSLDEKFKYWFQDQFIRKIKQHKIKALILCIQNAADLISAFAFQNQYFLKELELNDILPVSKQYLDDEDGFFCKGIMNEEDKVTYKLFKFKLQKNISV